MSISIIESVKTFLATCPYLSTLASVGVDFLPENPDTYSLEEVPTSHIVSTNIDGSSSRQFTFTFAARFHYSDELRNNIDNSGFFEDFSDWLEEQTEADNLPVLGDGLTATKIEAISSGYLFSLAGDFSSARYQISCRLLYDKD